MTLARPKWIAALGLLLAGLFVGLTGACSTHQSLSLTPEERAWIAQHPVIHWGADPGYPPIEWVEAGGVVKGLAPDYLARMGKILGVRFEPVLFPEWPEALAALASGKVDLLSNITDMPERRDRMLFTEGYLDMPSILLTRTDDSIRGLEDMNHRLMAVGRGYIVQDLLRRDHPKIRIREVISSEEGLQQLALGTVDGTIADLAQASWTIEHRQLTGIRMVCRLPEFPSEFAMAVRHDQPVLRNILNKALQAITPTERQELQRRWISLQTLGWHPTPAFWSALGIGLGLAAMAGVFFWNLTLRRRVKTRTKELERITQALVDLNAELVQTIAEVKTLRGLIPICMRCKKIRSDEGSWGQMEAYLSAHSDARFSHGYCPECVPIVKEEMRRELDIPLKDGPEHSHP